MTTGSSGLWHLPRWLWDGATVARLVALDRAHADETMRGQVVIRIHYDGNGTPKAVSVDPWRVQTS